MPFSSIHQLSFVQWYSVLTYDSPQVPCSKMKIPFQSSPQSTAGLRKPEPTALPELSSAQLAAVYRAARVGGDFYDFLQVGSKLLFVLLDIAGKRQTALHIAAAAQDL